MKKSLITLASIFFTINFAQAQMIDLGTLDGGDFSDALAVSSDGSIIVGSSNALGDDEFAVRFSNLITNPQGNPVILTAFAGVGNQHSAHDVSDSGIIVGGAPDQDGNSKAFKFENNVMTNLGTLGGGSSRAFGVADSNNGGIVVGFAENADNDFRAFKHENGVMTDLGTLGGLFSGARAISENGQVIVGFSEANDGLDYAFKYENGVMTNLGVLGTGQFSLAYGVSSDGSVVVGTSQIGNLNNNFRAFKHDAINGMVDLGTLGGFNSVAHGVSGDGSIVVGRSHNEDDEDRAFKHENGVMTNLGTLGGNRSEAFAISSDGTVIVGSSRNADGDNHAFMLLNEVGGGVGELVSINNTISVLEVNARRLGSVFNLNESLLFRSLEQDATLFGANNMHVEVGTRHSKSIYNNGDANASQFAATLKLAYRFNNNFRAGIFFDQGLNNEMPDNFSMRNSMPLTSVFAHYSQNADESGSFIHLAAAHGQSDLTITRDVLSNTEAGQGQSKLTSQGALIEAGYGFKISKTNVLQPYIGSRYTRIIRDGYVEDSGADFPITFQDAKKESSSAILGLRIKSNLSNKISAQLNSGFEKEISGSFDGYVGNISHLGSFNLSPEKIRQTRVFSEIGFDYKISELQRIGLRTFYSKQSTNSGDAFITYFSYGLGF